MSIASKGGGIRQILALLLGCDCAEARQPTYGWITWNKREEHWAIVDLVGKAAYIRTLRAPAWVKAAMDGGLTAAPIIEGRVFRCVTRKGSVWGKGIAEKVIWRVVKNSAASAGIAKLSLHDCRRTCAAVPRRGR